MCHRHQGGYLDSDLPFWGFLLEHECRGTSLKGVLQLLSRVCLLKTVT